jgi:hypothetical protein
MVRVGPPQQRFLAYPYKIKNQERLALCKFYKVDEEDMAGGNIRPYLVSILYGLPR